MRKNGGLTAYYFHEIRQLSASRKLQKRCALLPLSEIGTANIESEDQPIFHKNLQRVNYVIAGMAGRSPVEAVFFAGGLMIF